KCKNGGKWNGTHCECPSHYVGELCENLQLDCDNGGTWDGIKCLCTEQYTGQKCQDVVPSIDLKPPEIIEAQVEVTVTVTSQNFTEDLKNESSQAFKTFEKHFKERAVYHCQLGPAAAADPLPTLLSLQHPLAFQMAAIYSNIPEYQGVKIIKLSQGSVVVEHEVILKTNYTLEYQEVLKNVTETVEKTITTATEKNDNCTAGSAGICFKPEATKVQDFTVTNYDPEKECKERAGEGLRDYFYVEYKDKQPNCINECTPNFNRSINCNMGKCQMMAYRGPQCYPPFKRQSGGQAHQQKLGFISVHPLWLPTLHPTGLLLVLLKHPWVSRGSKTGRLWAVLALAQHESSLGPSLHLSCLTTDTHWFRGEKCEFSTQKSLVYGLVGAAGVVLLVILVILLVFLVRSRSQVK
ncbi:Mucin-17, partial [Galemys pyrenaicus]